MKAPARVIGRISRRLESSLRIYGDSMTPAHLPDGCTTTMPDGTRVRSAGGNAFWSFLIPGTGQFMNGQSAKGLLMLGGSIGAVAATDDPDTALGVLLAIGVWSTADAYVVANRLNVTDPLPRAQYRRYGEHIPLGKEPPLTIILDPITKQASAVLCYRF